MTFEFDLKWNEYLQTLMKQSLCKTLALYYFFSFKNIFLSELSSLSVAKRFNLVFIKIAIFFHFALAIHW